MTTTPTTSDNIFTIGQHTDQIRLKLNSLSDDSASPISSASRLNNSTAYSQLQAAVADGNLGLVKQMLDCDLDVNYVYDKEQNYSFLHLACLMGHSKIIKFLLDSGANPNVVTNDGHRPIDFIDSDNLTTISYMLLRMNSK